MAPIALCCTRQSRLRYKRTDGRRDGRYQVHYLPHFVVDNYETPLGKIPKYCLPETYNAGVTVKQSFIATKMKHSKGLDHNFKTFFPLKLFRIAQTPHPPLLSK